MFKVIVSLAAFLLVHPIVNADRIYWTYHPGAVWRINDDGSNMDQIVSGAGLYLKAIVVDAPSGKVFWSNIDTDTIWRASLDGSDQEALITASQCHGLAIDFDGRKLYWTERTTNRIRRANLDGSNAETVLTGLSAPLAVAIDPVDRKVYWSERNTRKIRRANIDGTSPEDVIPAGNFGTPIAMALDHVRRRVYWCDQDSSGFTPGYIRRANLDGSDIIDVVSSVFSWAVTVDVPRKKIIYGHQTAIRRSDLDGSNPEVIVDPAVPDGIALENAGLDVPSVSAWGLLILGLTILSAGILLVRRNSRVREEMMGRTKILFAHTSSL